MKRSLRWTSLTFGTGKKRREIFPAVSFACVRFCTNGSRRPRGSSLVVLGEPLSLFLLNADTSPSVLKFLVLVGGERRSKSPLPRLHGRPARASPVTKRPSPSSLGAGGPPSLPLRHVCFVRCWSAFLSFAAQLSFAESLLALVARCVSAGRSVGGWRVSLGSRKKVREDPSP